MILACPVEGTWTVPSTLAEFAPDGQPANNEWANGRCTLCGTQVMAKITMAAVEAVSARINGAKEIHRRRRAAADGIRRVAAGG